MSYGHKKQPGLTNPQSGFTLIEVMLAIFFFMLIALGLGNLCISTWRSETLSRRMTEASVIGSRNAESIISRRYQDALIAAGTHNATEDNYTVSYVISDDTILPDTKYVQMNVSYTIGGAVKNVRYHYLLPERVH